MWTLLCSCVKVREAIELLLGVSLNGFSSCVGKKRSVFDSCVKSLQYFGMDSISTESLLNTVLNVLC